MQVRCPLTRRVSSSLRGSIFLERFRQAGLSFHRTCTGAAVRIKQLAGWPPARFQAAEERGTFTPPSAAALELQTASLVPPVVARDTPEVFLLLKCPETEKLCSVRFKVKDASTAIRVVKALVASRDKKLADLGELEIREDEERFPGLRSIL